MCIYVPQDSRIGWAELLRCDFRVFQTSSRLSKCSLYVGVELGRVPEEQCERLAPSAFNTHVRKLAKKNAPIL